MLKNILSRLTKKREEKLKTNPVTTPYRYVISPQQCRSCERCKKVCKAGAISGERGQGAYVIDEEKCIKCGNCVKWCKHKAIQRLDFA